MTHDPKGSHDACGEPCDDYGKVRCENCSKTLYTCCDEVIRDDDNIPCCQPCAEKFWEEGATP